MKSKTICLLTTTLLCCFSAYSQSQKAGCLFEHAELPAPKIIFQANEVLEVNGTIPVHFTFLTFAACHIDSIKISPGDYFSPDSLTLTSGQYDSGIAENHSFNLIYDTTNKPYYYKEVKLTIYADSGAFHSLFWVYFTPYYTIEVLTQENFNHNRKWMVGDESMSPQRVYIDKDSIFFDIDTTLPVKYETIDGVAYYRPINYDSLEEDEPDSFVSGNLYKSGWETFRGNVSGTLIHPYLNERLNNVDLSLEGITVKVWKVKNKGDKLLATGVTDATGSFDINYDYSVLNSDGEIKIYVEFLLANSNVSVVWYYLVNRKWEHSTLTERRNHNLNAGNRQFFDFGIIPFGQVTFAQNFLWANKAVTFAKAELQGLSIYWAPLEIIIAAVGVENAINPEGAFYSNNVIQIDFANTTFESTTYHEVGHYVHFAIQNGKRQPNAGGTHTYVDNNAHPNQTITEGFADGFQFIVDSRYFIDDNEAIRELDGNGGVFVDNYHNVFDWNIRADLHSFTSEAMFGCALLDLWDSQSKFEGFANTLDEELIMDWDAQDIPQEEADFTFKEICMPFYNNRSSNEATIQDVPQYFKVLADYTSCVRKRNIREVTELNLINTLPGATVVFRPITTDKLTTTETIQHMNHDLFVNAAGFAERGPNAFNYNRSYNTIDVNFITNSNYSITPLNVTPVNGISTTWSISDPLIIENEKSLLFNVVDRDGFLGGNTTYYNFDNTITETSVCNDINVDGGSIEVGNAIASDNQHAIVNIVNSELRLTYPSVLRINDNSQLIIEEGSTLRIASGTIVILDGPDAILEIRGTLILEDNASFAPIGGGNGLGFVRFNMPGIGTPEVAANRIQFGNNSFIKFEGTSSSTKVMEVTDHVFWIVNSGSNNHFDVTNGMIEMGEDAVLNLGMRCVFNHVKVEPMTGISSFAGMYLWGHSYGLYDLTITGSGNGLNSFNNDGGLPLRINDLELQECGQGLLVDGRALILENPLIENGDNDYGIKVKGAHYPSKLTNPVISDVVVGTSYAGNSSSPLSMFFPNYTVTGNAVEFNATSSLMSRCGTFIGDNTGYGFRVSSGANVVMANAFGQAGGGNVFFNDVGGTKAFNETIRISGNPIYLDGGKNDLRFNSSGMALVGLTFWGVASNGDLAGGGNLWDNSSPYLPVSTQNYDLWYIPDPFPFFPPLFSRSTITGTHETPLTYSRSTYCAGSTTGTGAGTGNALPTNPRTITYGAPFQNVKNVFEDILTRQYDSVQAADIMPDWELALTASEWNTTRTVTDYVYLNIGLAKMNELAGDYLISDSAFLSNPDSTDGIFASVKNTINYWIARCDTASDLAAIQLLDYLKFQKAGLFCLVNDYSKAEVIYSDLAANGDSNLIPLAEYWVCQLDRVQQILERGTDYMFLDSLPECTVAFPEEYPEPVAIKIPGNGKNVTTVPLFRPNPVNSFLQLSLNGSAYDKVEIVNTMGQRVYENTLIKLDKDEYTFDISSLPEGLYMVTLINTKDFNKFTKKIVIAR